MFGYLRIDKGELKVREYEAYKAVYCGLCRQLGKDYSFPARMILSYDCTFYAILLMSLSRSCSGFRGGRCTCNPLKKCKFAACGDQSYSKASALSVITAYYKLVDNIRDNGFFRRLLYRLPQPFLSRWRKKAAKNYPELESAVSRMMKAQSEVEKSPSASVDEASHPTAQMLSAVLSLEGRDEMTRRILAELGYQLGRWVYLIDAADDLEKDFKSGGFNPFLKYRKEGREDEIGSILSTSLGRAWEAYCLINWVDFQGITDNMMRFGLPLIQNDVMSKLNKPTEVKDDKSL